MIGCIEYDGTKPIALRPGPPNACNSCCRISLEPLAAQRFSTSSGDAGLCGQVGGQVGAQRHRVAVGIAVQLTGHRLDGGRHVVDECLRRRMRVLVGVEPHRNVQLRCAVRRFAAQVLAQRQIGQRHLSLPARHASNLRRTASPWAGRFSACASVMTYPDTSLSAASS